MVIKKTPAKKVPAPIERIKRAPFVRPKRNSPINYFSYSFVIFITILFMVSVEAFFSFPSQWFHKDAPEPTLPLYEEVIVEGCTKEFDPVCGIDGKTYGNKCELNSVRVTFAYKGECKIKQNEAQVPSTQTGTVSSEVPNTQVSPDTLPTEGSGTAPVTLQNYKNPIFDYELSLPKYAYYRGYSTKDKKGHTLAIDLKDELTANFDNALVRVMYTKVGDPIPIGSKVTLSLDKGTITINYDEPITDKIKEIIDAITSTAMSTVD